VNLRGLRLAGPGTLYNHPMRVLFVCTGNTCRSPLAERLGRKLHPEHRWESAGVMPTGRMHPETAAVLGERNCDVLDFRGRHVDDLDLAGFDHVVLIGETAAALSPTPPAHVAVHHWDVADPFEVDGSPEVIRAAYHACADELARHIQELLDAG